MPWPLIAVSGWFAASIIGGLAFAKFIHAGKGGEDTAEADAAYMREVLDKIMPAQPQVADHHRAAATHLQLAREINWTPKSKLKAGL